MATEPKRSPGNVQSGVQEGLRQFLQENTPLLLGVIRSYVAHTGLAHGEAVQATAVDILQDAALEALRHADRLSADMQPRAWFLAIAANILKRKKAEAAKRQQREVLESEMAERAVEVEEDDIFDRLVARVQPGPEEGIESDERVTEMLSLVAHDDREVLRLALLNDLDTQSLAKALGITPGAARVRLHRALSRLRAAWNANQRKESASDA